jgi:hypothetical protein
MSTKRATPAKPDHESDSSCPSSVLFPPSSAQDTSLEQTAGQASALFTSTIRSLTHDVRALGHLTTWKDILEQDNHHGGDGNPANDDNDDERREAFLESLCDLDDVVSSVEKKVGVLRQIVVEEQRALENLNLLHKDSIHQNENLEYLVERCLQIKSHGGTGQVEERDAFEEQHHTNVMHNNSNSSNGHHYPSSSNSNNAKRSVFPDPGMSVGSTCSSSRHSMDSSHTHAQGLSVHLDRVTQEELENVPRTTRGRVQLLAINDALDNIERAFYKKATKERKQQLLLQEAKQASLSHYNNRSPEKIFCDDELLHNLVVSEQELRQTCSFFAVGELKARTILTVLKALRRIKQVPATKGKVLYKLCL